MRAEQLLKASSVHLAAGEADLAIDSAAWAYAVAADEDLRAAAAAAAALGSIDLGLPADAVVWGDRAVAAVPGHRPGLTCRALGHRALGRLELALADLDAAVDPELGDDSVEIPARARFARALVLAELGRRADGYQDLELITEDPRIGQLALRALGEWRLAEGDQAAAIDHFTAAARLGDRRSLAQLIDLSGDLPSDPEIRLTRLIALRIAEQTQDALALADELLARADLPPAVRARTLLNQGYARRLADGWAAAVPAFRAAAELAADDPEVITASGAALFRAGLPGEAEETLLRAVELEPGDGRAERCLAEVYAAEGRPELAAEWYERALVIVPADGEARFGLALARLELGCQDEGTQLAKLAAIAGHPGAAEWCRRNDLTLPADQLGEVIRTVGAGHNPFWAERILREAAAVWLDSSTGAGDGAARSAATALWYVALCEIEMGVPAEAEETLLRVIELRPGFGVAWQSLGDALVRLDRPNQAIEAYEQCAWFDPRQAAAPAGIAEALGQLGRGEDARAALDRAIELGYPDDPARQHELYFRRARLCQALGDWAGAAADFARMTGGGAFDSDDIAEWLSGVQAIGELVVSEVGADKPWEYRTYGMSRDEWDGYGGIDWPVRIRFVDEPDEALRSRLAAEVGRCLRAAVELPQDPRPVVDLSVTAHWSAGFLLLRIRADEGENLGALRIPVALAVEAMHRILPITEVVNFAAQGVAVGTDEVERWSVATAPVPAAGPDFGVRIGFWVPALAAEPFPEPFVDPAAAEALWQALTGPTPVTEVKLVMLGPDDPPPPGPPNFELGPLRRYPNDYGRFAANGAGVVVRRPEEFHTHLDRVSPGGEVRTVVDGESLVGEGDELARQIEAVSIAPDGSFAMFATTLGRDLYLVDLATGATAVLMEGVPRVESTAFLTENLIMVKTSAWLAVFTLTPTGPVLVARDVAETGPAVVAAAGRLIIVGGVREPELVVYGFAEGALGRLAELSAPINCYRVWAVDDRVFAADRSVFEAVGLLPAWERFAAWAATIPGREPGGGLVVEELDDAPYTGIGDGLDGIREVAFWCVKGSAGLLLAVREVAEGHEILVGDPTIVVSVQPSLKQSGFEYDWRPDGRALLVKGNDSAVAYEVDVARATAHPVAYSAAQACYTATGFAVLRPGTLALYAWRHGSEDEPVELVRYPVPQLAATFGWADGGRVLHLTAGDHTGLYVVGGGALYPIGSFPADDWFSGWNHDGALHFANRHSGRQFRAFRVSGFSSAVVEALGRSPVDRLVPAELPRLRVIERPVYPGTTRWRYFSDD